MNLQLASYLKFKRVQKMNQLVYLYIIVKIKQNSLFIYQTRLISGYTIMSKLWLLFLHNIILVSNVKIINLRGIISNLNA